MTEKLSSDLFFAYINLERSQERGLNMERQLKALGLPFRRFEATDGSKYEFDPADKQSGLSLGELGCAHSHQSVLRQFLNQSEAPFCLVMEDDIDIDPTIRPVIEDLLTSLSPQDSLVVQFDYAPVGIRGAIMWWFLFKNLLVNRKGRWSFWLLFPVYLAKGILVSLLNLWAGLQDWWLRKNHSYKLKSAYRDRYLAGCYLVTKSAAEQMISLNTPLNLAADAVHNIARRKKLLKHYWCSPRLVRQKRESFASTLDNTHFGKKIIAY